ncbi:MAG: hypothetical protein WCV70_02810 [Patescibacteria group bacterium]
MSIKVLFYYWDWKGQIEIDTLQRAVNAVFDGVHPPYITDKISGLDWDQYTIAVCSQPVTSEVLGKLFNDNDESEDYWWEELGEPKPLKF